MRLFGLGKDTTFQVLLEAQADAACRAAEEFRDLARDFTAAAERTKRIEEIEREADKLTHELANKVDATFVTPLDKEDLHGLSSALDDVTDAIEAAAGRIGMYRLNTARDDLVPLADGLVAATGATRDAVAALRDLKGRDALRDVLIRVHDAEDRGDSLYRGALADLFNAAGADPILVMKGKEVYDRIELALDACEDVSNRVESVAVKYA
jgi:predicted phosphate transport protein (TIGR00153 family)